MKKQITKKAATRIAQLYNTMDAAFLMRKSAEGASFIEWTDRAYRASMDLFEEFGIETAHHGSDTEWFEVRRHEHVQSQELLAKINAA